MRSGSGGWRRRIVFAALLTVFPAGLVLGQVSVVPGSKPLCQADIENSGGQESQTILALNQVRARSDGAGDTSSFAEVGIRFTPAMSFPAQLTMDGVAAVGRMQDLALPASTYRLEFILRDLDAGTEVASVVVMSGSEFNGPQVINNPFDTGVLAANLTGGTTYAAVLRLETESNGALASVDFLSGDRLARFACVAILPTLDDADGDGLYDQWEETGIDIDGGGVDLDLQALGTDFRGVAIKPDPQRKDILVEIDYFDCNQAGGDCTAGDAHSHRPMDAALQTVVEAFANAPVSNPEGGNGINLWIVVDEALAHQQNCDLDAPCFDPIKNDRLGPAGESAVRVTARQLVFHYNLWVHMKAATNGSSGEADGGCDGGDVPKWGDDFVVSLGNFSGNVGTQDNQTGTFMHELGHNLGLCHGGGDDINCKPNYLSVMSYTFALNGLPPSTTFDYSRAALPGAGSLVENDLDETLGIEDGTLQTFHGPPIDINGIDENGDGDLTDDWSLGAGSGSIDWNLDGQIDTDVASDINNLEIGGCGSSADPQTLVGLDDWSSLHFNFRDSEFFPSGHAPGADQEIDHETAERIRQSTWAARSRSGTRYDYSAKIICGLQPERQGMRLTQGFYGTTINIRNPGDRLAEFLKSLALSFPPAEQAPGDRRLLALDALPAGRALKVDCEDVRRRLYPDGFPENYIEGFIVLQSNRRLDVTAVYTTAAVDQRGQVTGHSSIDVESVAGSARHLDLRVTKSAESACIPNFGALSLCLALYEIVVENRGPADATELVIDDELTRETLPVAVVPGVFEIDPPGQFLINDFTGTAVKAKILIPELLAGQTATVRFWSVAPLFGDLRDSLLNRATAHSNEPDFNPANNTATVEVPLP